MQGAAAHIDGLIESAAANEQDRQVIQARWFWRSSSKRFLIRRNSLVQPPLLLANHGQICQCSRMIRPQARRLNEMTRRFFVHPVAEKHRAQVVVPFGFVWPKIESRGQQISRLV